MKEKKMSGETKSESSEITKEFLENVLKRSVKSFKVSGGTNPGDNFTSILYSIEVHLKEEGPPLHLLVKLFHPDRQSFLEDSDSFAREMFMYGVLAPEYMKMQKDVIGNEEILTPAIPMYFGGKAAPQPKLSREDKDGSKTAENGIANATENGIAKPGENGIENYIMMLDIRKSFGFRMADKIKGLDLNHCQLVITELSKLHALSLAYKLNNRLTKLVDKYPLLEDAVFTETNKFIVPMGERNLATIADLLERNLDAIAAPGIDKHETLKSVKMLAGNVSKTYGVYTGSSGIKEEAARKFRRVKDDVELHIDQWLVGSHGDCWVNNMLFRYDEQNKPTEVVLVDLQMVRESCLTLDLSYLIYTSTDDNLRKNHLDDLLKLYHDKFVHYCGILKIQPFDGFNLENLNRRFHRSKIFGFAMAALILPIILQDNSVDLKAQIAKTERGEELLKIKFLGMIQALAEEGVL